MKKIRSGKIYYLPSLVFFLDDIDRICNFFIGNDYKVLSICSCEYEIDVDEKLHNEFDKLSKEIARDYVTNFEINVGNSEGLHLLSIKFECDDALIYFSGSLNDVEREGLFLSFKKLVNNRKRKILWYFTRNHPFSSYVLLEIIFFWVIFSLGFHLTRIENLYAIGNFSFNGLYIGSFLIFISLLLITYINYIYMCKYSVVWLKVYKCSSFFRRNRDALVVCTIGTIIGGLILGFVFK